MSSHLYDTVDHPFWQVSPVADTWNQEIVPQLPKDLEEQAWRLGAMSRKSGKVESASDLLRGILAYVLLFNSFRSLAVWGVLAEVADMASTSWRDRVRKSSTWLFWILSELLRPSRQKMHPILKKAGYESIELVDASHWKCCGKHGKTWRFHCMYSLFTQQLQQVMISSTKVAESLKHFCLQKGVIYVHDGGYGYRKEVAQTAEAGAYTVTSFSPASFPLEDAEGQPIVLVEWLKKFRAKAGTVRSLSAFFREGGKRYEVRVVALRRTKEQQERVLSKKKKSAGRDHRQIQAETIYLSHWQLVLTTLPAKDWSAQEVLSLYRARWQIEMLFKRIKQFMDAHILNVKTEETAKATVAAILVSWVLQQEVAQEMRSILTEVEKELEVAEGEGDEKYVAQIISEWMVQKASVDLFRQQVQGSLTREKVLLCLPKLKRHMREWPRKRAHQWQRVTQWLVDAEKMADSPGFGKSRNTGSALTTVLASR